MINNWIVMAVLAGLASALIFAAAGIPTFTAAAVFLLAPADRRAGLGVGGRADRRGDRRTGAEPRHRLGLRRPLSPGDRAAGGDHIEARPAAAAGAGGPGRRRRGPRRRCRMVPGRARAD